MNGESIIVGTITVIVIYAAVRKANQYVPKLFKKLGVRSLPQKKINKLKNKEYPKYYLIFTVLYLLLLISLSAGGMLYSVFWFKGFQYSLYGVNSLYFDSKGAGIVGLLAFFALLILGGGIIGLFFYLLGSPSFKEYIAYGGRGKSQLSWNLNVVESMRIFIIVGIIYCILVSPFIFLASRNYIAIRNNEVVDNPFFSIHNRTFPLSSIKNIKIVAEEDRKGRYVDIAIIVNLKDGEKLNWEENSLQLKKTATELNIPLIIQRPSERVLQIVSNECIEYQQDFYSIFEITMPISTGAGHC